MISTILVLAPDETGTTVTTSADARWTATVQYASLETTPWGVNSAGQTYGMQNKNGTPDLIAVVASNGLRGYAYATDLNNRSYAVGGSESRSTVVPRTVLGT